MTVVGYALLKVQSLILKSANGVILVKKIECGSQSSSKLSASVSVSVCSLMLGLDNFGATSCQGGACNREYIRRLCVCVYLPYLLSTFIFYMIHTHVICFLLGQGLSLEVQCLVLCVTTTSGRWQRV